MPTVARFYGIDIRLYYEEHGVPHFHVYYAEYEASVSIETLGVLHGHLPTRVQAMVLEWAIVTRDELRDNWKRAQAHIPLRPLEPME